MVSYSSLLRLKRSKAVINSFPINHWFILKYLINYDKKGRFVAKQAQKLINPTKALYFQLVRDISLLLSKYTCYIL